MKEHQRHFPVNWIDGMKINKNHFIDQDNAWTDSFHEVASLAVTPLKYGVLPASSAGENTFSVSLSLDNQQALRVSVMACQAITLGGIRISIPAISVNGQPDSGTLLTETFPFPATNTETAWWVFLFVHPFEKEPAGTADLNENPPRKPYLLPRYSLKLVSGSNYREYANHSYAMPIGMVTGSGKDIKVENEYIPPCYSIAANPDLVDLHGFLDRYLSNIELHCSKIIQKIYSKEQQTSISELVRYLCDRTIFYLGQAIPMMRWKMIYEPPVEMFMIIATLARLMQNTIDQRVGSGKDELMEYMGEWCNMRPGEVEEILINMSNASFNHNDINDTISSLVKFANTTSLLFKTLNDLELIGPKPAGPKKAVTFVDEKKPDPPKSSGRFLG